ncbi:hypothetical protein AU194_24140 [Mycobacterium sp. GA-2829]|nr:hypothetical protein AU194_24140 [Mycobacterium sp. GA-2829]
MERLARPLTPMNDGLLVGEAPDALWVAISRDTGGDGPPDAFLLGRYGDRHAQYIGNTPGVIIKLLAGVQRPVDVSPIGPDLQVGFPGLRDRELTYVGSWQWGIHGEARDDEFVRRAAAATLSVIRANTE